jgi:acetyl-CoA acetyltransferase
MSSSMLPRIVIVSVARTPITKFGGTLSSLSATQLGAQAIQGALTRLRSGGGATDTSSNTDHNTEP